MKYRLAIEVLQRPAVTKPLRGVLVGALLGTVALVALCSARVALDYVKEFQFENAAKREAQLAAAHGRNEAEIRDALLDKAHSLDRSIEQNAIVVHVTPPATVDRETGNMLNVLGIQTRTTVMGRVDIAVSYSVPFRYPGGCATLQFHFGVSDRDI
jgi:hypothetical protein